MTMAVAEVRRKLMPGTVFTGEFVGKNATLCAPGMGKTRRKVVKNSAYQMVSQFMDGPRDGTKIFLTWKSIRAEQDGESILLTMADDSGPFLRITVEGGGS